MLLLGAGESGKSTISKQFLVINGCFGEGELKRHKRIIQSNCIDCVKLLLKSCDMSEISPQNHERAERLLNMSTISAQLTPELGQDLKSLLADPTVKSAFEHREELMLPDCASYLFERLDKISDSNYMPTIDDCIRCRQRTTGVIESQFVFKGTQFIVVDVGGQRSERRKWIHCFDNVKIVLFCAALNEYDMTLREDKRVNRMAESLKLFQEICNEPSLLRIPVILFLNKKDLFEEKISNVDLTCLFPEYQGGLSYNSALDFIKGAYCILARKDDRKLFVHVTCAIDRQNVEFVWSAIHNIVTEVALKKTMIM